MIKAKVINNIITEEECQFILSILKDIENWTKIEDNIWDNRTLGLGFFYKKYPDVANLFLDIKDRIELVIKNEYMINQDIYADMIQAVRWFPGNEQSPHCDDMIYGEDIQEDLKWFAHRDFGSVLYLNEDYEGGELFYPDYKFLIKPKARSLAFHPGTKDHMHGVTKVEGSIRYTISSFWSFDKSFEGDWNVH